MDDLRIDGPADAPPNTLLRFVAAGYPAGAGLTWSVSPPPDPADVATTPPDVTEWVGRPGLYTVRLGAVVLGPHPPDGMTTREVSRVVRVSGGLPPP